MRGTKAKAVRKLIYGDEAIRGNRKYYYIPNSFTIVTDPNGKRHAYQMAKKTFANVRVR